VPAPPPSPDKPHPSEPVAEAKAPNIPITQAIKEGDIEAVKQHLAAGADVNAIVDDWTPLHNAAEYGQTTIAELLIEKGANVNTRYVDGETPLDVAIHPEISNKTDEIADLLRKHAARRVKN
jgi:ankyrin repeat protein